MRVKNRVHVFIFKGKMSVDSTAIGIDGFKTVRN